jgi:hypothetical protein
MKDKNIKFSISSDLLIESYYSSINLNEEYYDKNGNLLPEEKWPYSLN